MYQTQLRSTQFTSKVRFVKRLANYIDNMNLTRLKGPIEESFSIKTIQGNQKNIIKGKYGGGGGGGTPTKITQPIFVKNPSIYFWGY